MSTVDLDRAAYGRWLRAQRPPLTWFLGLSDLEQTALAELGDEYVTDYMIALATAIQHPTESAARTGDEQAEADLLRAAAVATLHRRAEGPTGPRPGVDTLSGFGRRKAAALAAQKPRRPQT
jgi:hypothetical protein